LERSGNDLIDGLIKLMRSEDGFTGPVNLGNPSPITIRELAYAIKELTGSPSEIRHEPLPDDDPRQRRPDIALATKALDWSPAVQLEDGLRRTIAYFAEFIANGAP